MRIETLGNGYRSWRAAVDQDSMIDASTYATAEPGVTLGTPATGCTGEITECDVLGITVEDSPKITGT